MDATLYPPSSAETFLHWCRDECMAAELAQWGARAIEAGWDSPSLRELGALHYDPAPDLNQARRCFVACLEELKLALPSEMEAAELLVRSVCQRLLDDAITLPEATALIHRMVLTPMQHPERWMAWCHLEDGIDPRTLSAVEDPERLATLAKDEARRELS